MNHENKRTYRRRIRDRVCCWIKTGRIAKTEQLSTKRKECLSDLYKCDDNFEPEEPDVECTCCGCKLDDGDYFYCISGEILREDCLNDQYRRIV
nr:MAG TPA: hypothetical protein [Bacteriophage sp.]